MMAPTLNGLRARSTAIESGRRRPARLSRISSRGMANGGTFTGSRAVVAAGSGTSSVMVSRNGTGMKIATNTTTMSQNSALRLAGRGRGWTGGWLAPPPARRTAATSANQTSHGKDAKSATDDADALAVVSAHLDAHEVAHPEEDAHADERHHRVKTPREDVVAVAEVRRRDVPAVELADGQQVDHRHEQARPARVRRRVQVDVLVPVGQPQALRGELEARVEERVALELALRHERPDAASARGRRG